MGRGAGPGTGEWSGAEQGCPSGRAVAILDGPIGGTPALPLTVSSAVTFSRVIAVNPPSPPGRTSNKDSMGGFGQLYHEGAAPFPPLDMPYLAAAVTAAGGTIDIIEAGALRLGIDAVLERLAAAPDIHQTLVVVRTSLPTIDLDLDFCATVRARCAPAAVVIYGPVVKPLLWRIQAHGGADMAIIGESDGPVVELLAGTALRDIPGLVWRGADGWVQNAERPFEKDLAKLPFPRWDLMPTDRYIIPQSSAAGSLRFLPMLSSRGCPFGCNYCPYPVGQGLPWRNRDAMNVVDELEHLVRNYGVEYVIFRDPLFSANKKRVQAICEEILHRGVSIKWRCETRIDCLDEPTIEIMARAGCVGVNFGVESSDPQVQKNVERKPIAEEQFLETMACFRKHGIATFAFFVVGLPGDTVDTILESIAFALKLNASFTQFTVATPFIGTRLHDWAVEQGFIAGDHYQILSANEGSLGNENLTPAQVHRLHRFAQILQRNLINRRGILKNDLRRDRLYVTAKHALDAALEPVKFVFFRAGSWVLKTTMPKTRRGAATVVPGRKKRAALEAVP